MTDQDAVDRARKAREIIESPLWTEAWDAYRAKLVDIIDRADRPDDVCSGYDDVMQA